MCESNLSKFCEFLKSEQGLALPGQDAQGYAALHQWSVQHLDQFWSAIAKFFGVIWRAPPQAALTKAEMPGTEWFAGGQLNFAEHLLRHADARAEAVAILALSDSGARRQLTFGELGEAVARCRAGLVKLGVGQGDRVAGYLSNTPEAAIAFMACASLGAIWSSCPPEFGVGSVLDRFRQIEPKVLIAVDGYAYGGKWFDRRSEVQQIHEQLPGEPSLVWLSQGEDRPSGVSWEQLNAETAPLEFAALPFEHPLWILYSSGTTGMPKAIVHGHGGILLEHYKVLGLHSNLGPEDRFFWFSTTGWMMWNYLVSGLLVGATIVLYEGNPGYPDLGALWRLAADERFTYFGTSAPFLMACRARELDLSGLDLTRIRGVGSTGAPLPAEGFEWVYENVGQDLLLGSVSGGTDLCTAFVLSCPWLSVHAGELQCSGLGADVQSFDEAGQRLIGEVGELVIKRPMPCMPLYFWNDVGGKRYERSYFSKFPGVWRHGDWIRQFEDGAAVIYGRSDSTLNRGGVRMGTSEFYRVVEELPEIQDSLVVDTSELGQEGKLWLFVVLNGADGDDMPEDFTLALKRHLREKLSPRHVPDTFVRIRAVPYTLSGKKLEVPVKKILQGRPLEEVANLGTLKDPDALRELAKRAAALT